MPAGRHVCPEMDPERRRLSSSHARNRFRQPGAANGVRRPIVAPGEVRSQALKFFSIPPISEPVRLSLLFLRQEAREDLALSLLCVGLAGQRFELVAARLP